MKNLKLINGNIKDIDQITKYRMKLWDDAGKFSSSKEYDDLYIKNREYLTENLKGGKIVIPMFVDDDKNIVSIGIGVILQKPPVNWDNSGLEGYIFNMYTDINYRNRGLSKNIMDEIFLFFQQSNVTTVNLTSNKNSFKLYEKYGMKTNQFYQEIKI